MQMPLNYDWMQTYMGKRIYPLAPDPDLINMTDIAHSLAHQCRFAGHCRLFYSVAEHSIRAAYLCPEKDRLWALLHDSAEAYLVDFPRPIKNCSEISEWYYRSETRLLNCIMAKYGLPALMPDSVHEADEIMLATEAHDLFITSTQGWKLNKTASKYGRLKLPLDSEYPTIMHSIEPLAPIDAELLFLDLFDSFRKLAAGVSA